MSGLLNKTNSEQLKYVSTHNFDGYYYCDVINLKTSIRSKAILEDDKIHIKSDNYNEVVDEKTFNEDYKILDIEY